MLHLPKILLYSILLLIFPTAGKSYLYSTPPPGPVRNIAEFEPMEGVLIRYPAQLPTEMVKEIVEDVQIYCLVDSGKVAEAGTYFFTAGIDTSGITLVSHTPGTFYEQPWTRDYGPCWIADGEGKISVVDFTYTDSTTDDVPSLIAGLLNVNCYAADLTHVGGNYMTDGMGVSASTDLVLTQNSNYTLDQINAIVNEYLGISTYHILDDPLTIELDHIDCWEKFLAVDKVLILSVPASHPDYSRLEQAAEYFKTHISSYGTPYQVVRVYISGSDLEAYTNALILNNKVLVPLSETANDSSALSVYKSAMPGYEVVGFTGPPPSGWYPHDAIHCRTKGIPDRGMLYIGHKPLHDTIIDTGNGYCIEAAIIPYSKQALIADSCVVMWKTDTQTIYTTVKMSPLSGDTFRAVIPSLGKHADLSYYIQAADESGRREKHPCIGAPDPHTFYGLYKNSSISITQGIYNTLVCTSYPNPFRKKTVITYTLASKSTNATLSIFNTRGSLFAGGFCIPGARRLPGVAIIRTGSRLLPASIFIESEMGIL